MKKSLLAVAAIGAFASAAQAQSSVTVYGILDTSFSGKSTSVPTSTAGAPQGSSKTNTAAFIADAEQSSRLGFKGVEDLGGGMSAVFTIETGLTPASSQMSTLNNRQSFVGIGKKGLGVAAIGTQYTPIHVAFAATDPGGNNNTVGNVVRPTAGTAGGQSSASSAYTISTTNTLTAQSESFAGFKVNAQYTINAKDATQYSTVASTNVSNGGNTNFTGYGLGVNYTWQKLFVTAAYQSFKTEIDHAATALTAAIAATPGTTITELSLPNTTDNQTYAGAVYDFGILKAYANYINRKMTNNLNSNEYLKRSAQQIGVRANLTPTIETWASGGTGKFSAFGVSSPSVNFNAWQLGSNYWLSKRTNLYAIYGQTLTSNASTTSTLNIAAGGGTKASQYAVGIRHTF